MAKVFNDTYINMSVCGQNLITLARNEFNKPDAGMKLNAVKNLLWR